MQLRSHSLCLRPLRVLALALALALLVISSPPVAADIIHLTNGGTVEGEITERGADELKVRTSIGVVSLPLNSIERIEESASIRSQYDERAAKVGDSAPAHVELALWCGENGLQSQRRTHLQRAIAIDPDSEAARRALGHVKLNGLWVEGSAEKPASRPAERKGGVLRGSASAPAAAQPAGEEKLVGEIQGNWSIRVRSIRDNMLDSGVAAIEARGRAKLDEIRDPLAVLPMVRLLSAGGPASRAALVDVLRRFDSDEATLNLGAIALLDHEDSIRDQAVRELVRRNDPRVGPQIRRALQSQNDELVRRAAIALGRLRDSGAVPDLIDVLTAQRRKRVEVVADYFNNYAQTFNRPAEIGIGDNRSLHYRGQLGVSTITLPGAVPIPRTEIRVADVTVFRTEVMEALKAITGHNFGFDGADWRRWYEEQRP